VIGTISRECLDHVIVFNEASGRFTAISATTTGRERTSRWTRMRQSPDLCRRLNSETSSPYPKSEFYITATNGARPEIRSQPRHRAGQVPLELVREPIQVADTRARISQANCHTYFSGDRTSATRILTQMRFARTTTQPHAASGRSGRN